MNFKHQSVLLKETIASLNLQSGGLYVDGTLGGGGHSQAILEATAPDGCLLGLDRDDDALAAATAAFGFYYHMAMKEFGGVTGDLAGYFLQVCELGMLAALAFFL